MPLFLKQSNAFTLITKKLVGWRIRVEGAVFADVRRRQALRIGESGFAGEHNRDSVVDLSRWRVAVHPVHVENVDVTICFELSFKWSWAAMEVYETVQGKQYKIAHFPKNLSYF